MNEEKKLYILLGIIGAIIGIEIEKNRFNKGICPNCGDKLLLFDYDSMSSRGYICGSCQYTIWISYNCVDKNYKKGNK